MPTLEGFKESTAERNDRWLREASLAEVLNQTTDLDFITNYIDKQLQDLSGRDGLTDEELEVTRSAAETFAQLASKLSRNPRLNNVQVAEKVDASIRRFVAGGLQARLREAREIRERKVRKDFKRRHPGVRF